MNEFTPYPNAIHRSFKWLVVGFLIFGFFGCGYTPERWHPHYSMYRHEMERVLLLPPEIGLFEEMPDGSLKWQKNGSWKARNNTQQAVVAALKLKGFDVRIADPQFVNQAETQDAQALFRSVNRSIQLHAYGPQLFPVKQEVFDYGIGPVRQVLKAAGADGLVLVVGQQVASRKHGKTWISIAIVEPGGAIIWYAMQGAKEDLGLQTPNNAMRLVDRTLQSLQRSES